jgi:hypothetical protein
MARLHDEKDQWDNLLDEIERLKKEGLATLKAAGLSKERHDEAADKLINLFSVLPGLAEVLEQVEDFLAKPRSQHNHDRLAALAAYLIDVVEEAIRQIVRHAIDETVREYKNPPPPPKEVIKEIYVEPPKPWYERFFEFLDEDEAAAEGMATVLLGVLLGGWIVCSWIVFESFWWAWAFLFPVLAGLLFIPNWVFRSVTLIVATLLLVVIF